MQCSQMTHPQRERERERVTSATAHTLYDSLLDHTLREWNIVPTETSTPHTPRLRFRGFTDPWQRKQLGDVAVVSRGLTYHPSDVRPQGVRVLRSSNIAGDAFVTSEEDIFVVRSCVNVDYARNGDILITAANGSAQLVGKHCIVDNIVDESMVAGGFMFLLRSLQPHFLNASMSSSWYTRFISITSMGGGGSINNLRKNELEELYLTIPSLAEQKQIGAFFRSQDEGIATATEQIDKLKRIKQACLKQMFV